MQQNLFEIILGIIVIIFALGLGIFVFKNYGTKNKNCYTVTATFNNAAGLKTGAEVKLAGILVGRVTKATLDQKNYSALLEICINNGISVPKDSFLLITSDAIFTDKYIKIDPGSEETNLKEGDTIVNTQSALSIEELLSKFLSFLPRILSPS